MVTTPALSTVRVEMYRRKQPDTCPLVYATQWNKVGDHTAVYYDSEREQHMIRTNPGRTGPITIHKGTWIVQPLASAHGWDRLRLYDDGTFRLLYAHENDTEPSDTEVVDWMTQNVESLALYLEQRRKDPPLVINIRDYCIAQMKAKKEA